MLILSAASIHIENPVDEIIDSKRFNRRKVKTREWEKHIKTIKNILRRCTAELFPKNACLNEISNFLPASDRKNE